MQQKFRKKPIEIEAVQWWKNGDHPEDGVGEIAPDPAGGEYRRIEGAVVRFFRHPDYPGDQTHDRCGRTWHDHGWIDTIEGGHTACPGDWIITGVQGERYPCKPDIFEATYEAVVSGPELPPRHASPGCACGVNDIGQRYVDPICR